MKKKKAIYELHAINRGMVRSVRWLSSTELIAFNFCRKRMPAAGINKVNITTMDRNQILSVKGKTTEYISGRSIRAETVSVGIISG